MLNKSWMFTLGWKGFLLRENQENNDLNHHWMSPQRKSGFLLCSWSVSVFPTAADSAWRTKVNLQLFLQPGSLSQIDILQTLRRKLLSLLSSKCFQLHSPPPPVVLVASAVIQRLVFVMSLRTNSWVRNRNLPWKFCSVPCSPSPPPPLLTLSILHSEAQQSQPAVPLQTQLKQAALHYRCRCRRCCYFRAVSALTPSTQTQQCGDPFSFPSNWWYQSHLNQAEPLPGPDNHRLALKDDPDVSICLFFLLSSTPPPPPPPLRFIFLASVSVSYPLDFRRGSSGALRYARTPREEV